ncbi:hypothetical protein A3D00_05645 [Candidatus Woesebacteria bacterium RIFCSPHIGHO2_02_FULL_38_9]|nr:MAG: hypothetical protein A3D00_05645 [Candidatus Woesebacteria bacterium RIFCSPHIGHO2_02_FULL_38_9]
MNISLLITTILLLLLIGYFAILPLSKKRPVLIKNIGVPLFTLTIFGIAALLSYLFIFWIGVSIALCLYFMCLWIVFGVTKDKLAEALQKATVMTRASFEIDGKIYLIDGSMRIGISNLGKKTNFIYFRNKNGSKRANLAKEVFRKFIQNYFLE